MVITPFSYFLLFVLIIIFIFLARDWEKNVYYLLALLIICETYLNRGYFIDLGIIRPLQYNEFLIIIVSPLFVFKQLGCEKNTKAISLTYFYMSSLLIGVMALLIFKPDFPVIPIGASVDLLYSQTIWHQVDLETPEFGINNIFRLIKVMLYLPVLFYFASSKLNPNKINNVIITVAKIVCVVIAIELIMKLIGWGSYYDIALQYIFDEEGSINFTRLGLVTLSGISQEPSHLAYGFFAPLFLLATRKSSNWMLFLIILLFLILSMSFGNFMLAFIGVALYFIYSRYSFNKLKYSTLFGAIIAVIVVAYLMFIIPKEIFVFNFSRLGSFFDGDYLGSEGIRLWSIGQNMSYFYKRPLFGLGLGSTISNGFIPSMLANIGIVGALLWFSMHVKILKTKLEFMPAAAMLVFLFFTGDIGWLYSVKAILIFLVISKGVIASPNLKIVFSGEEDTEIELNRNSKVLSYYE